MYARTAFAFTLCLLATSCTKSKSASANAHKVSPNLSIQAINGKCLNLESIVAQVSQPDFRFPTYAYTRDFALNGEPSERDKAIYAMSFRQRNEPTRLLADLKGLTQTDCDHVTLDFVDGVRADYKITSYTESSLDFQLDPSTLDSSTLPALLKDTLPTLPAVTKYTVRVPNPNRLEVVTEYSTPSDLCAGTDTRTAHEEIIYTWSGSGAALTAASGIAVNRTYWQKLQDVSAVPVPDPGTDPTPSDAIIPESPSTDTVTISADQLSATIAALKALPRVHCK